MKDIDRQRLFDAVLAYIVRSGAATPAVCQRLPLESAEFQLLVQAVDEILEYEKQNTHEWAATADRFCSQVMEHEQTIATLTNSLQEIVRDQGRVCEEFETCKHEACRSSYTSWQIAKSALELQVDKKQTEKL